MKTQRSQITMTQSQLFIKRKPKIFCNQAKQALNICSNKLCYKYAFVCSDLNCVCRQTHQQCLKTQIQSLMNNITNKINTKPLVKRIEEIFIQIQTELQSIKLKILSNLTEHSIQSSLTLQEKQLIQCIQTQKYKQINGNLIWKIQAQLFKTMQNDDTIQKILKNIDMVKDRFSQQIDKFHINVQKCLKQLQIKTQKLFQSSKIIKSQSDILTIQSFFQPKCLSSFLLYRASDNQFLIQKFYQLASNIQNTLTICETQYGKIIGGFTHLSWYKTQKCQQIPDQKGKSFIFSLSNKDKFTLKNNKYAINRSSSNSYGPAFGNGWDLFIRDKANKNIHSGGRINTSYFNQNYTSQNKQSKFLGTSKDNCNCKLKQWQVWKLTLSNQSQDI